MTQVIAKRYQILEERGAGGMGTVYRGMDTRSDNSVAIKLLNPQIASPSLIERFKREGEALRELNHPNIVKMLDAVEEDNSHYLIMEYVDGGDLSHLLEDSHLPIERCVKMALDLADALTRAHKLDIIHRDLKPANILIAEDGTLRLTDFGVAHMSRMERVTDSNAMVGTIDYMPPETFEQQPVDERADVWSFGVILFEMLTCMRPFTGKTIVQVIHTIVSEPVPDLEEHRPDAPIALVDLIYRMLAKDPKQRVPSVRIVGAELEAILKGYAIRETKPFTPSPDSPKTTIPTSITRFQTPKPDTGEIRNNLPAQITDFVGREDELAELENYLANPSSRMITVLAPGGMGKTRLALESAKQNMANYTDGVFFVELAPLETVDDIVPAIADAVKFQFYPGGEPKEQLLDYFRNKNILLVMDNYEHLLDGTKIVGEILKAAEQMTILATSRSKLNVRGETLVLLGSMEFPEWETPEDAIQYSSVKLFMQSARRVRPDFELEQDDLTFISRICRMVNGMPLGIELAAAWLEMLSPEEVADELSNSPDFLEAEGDDLPERQRSLRAVFEYSWNLLSEGERDALMKLAVFRTEFSRNGAQTVTGAGLRDLMALVNKSLLQRDPASGAYAIHKMLQQYAEEYLDQSGEVTAIRDAHSAYFLVALAERENQLLGAEGLKFLDDIETSIEDVRAAMNWASQQGYFEQINNALRSIWHYFIYRSKSLIAIPFFQQWIDNLKQLPQSSERDNSIGWILIAKSNLHSSMGQNEQSRDLVKEAESLIDASAMLIVQAYLEQMLGANEIGLPKVIRPYHERALALFRQAGDVMGEAFAIGQVSFSYWQDDWVQAEKYILQAYNMLKDLGNLTMMPYMCMNRANVAIQTDPERIDEAKLLYLEARDYAVAMGDMNFSGSSLRNLGIALYFSARYDEAIQYYQEAVEVSLEVGNLMRAARSLSNIAGVYENRAEYDKVEETYKQALNYATESKDIVWQAITHARYAAFCSIVGRYDTALKASEKQLEFVKQWDDEKILSWAYSDLARTYLKRHEFEQALSYAEQSLESAQEHEFENIIIVAKEIQAATLVQMASYDEAEELINPVINYYQNEIKDPNAPIEDLPPALITRCMILCHKGQIDEARQDIVHALRNVHQRPAWSLYGTVLAGFAIWLDAAGHQEKAAELASYIVSEERFAHYSRRDTQPLLDALADDYPEAIERGKQTDLNTMIEELLAEFDIE